MPHFKSLKRLAPITLLAFYASASVAEIIERPPNQPQFTMVSAERALAINADLGATRENSGESRNSSIRDGQREDKLEPVNLHIELRHALPRHMGYEVRGDGQVGLEDSFTPQRIALAGVSDVNISAFTSGSEYCVGGTGAALVESSYHFELNSKSIVTLSMSSFINAEDENYTFSLARISSTRPVIIWSDTTVFDADDNIQRDFSRKLELKPGTYRMMVKLQASSAHNCSDGNAENTRASVSLEIDGATELPLGKSK